MTTTEARLQVGPYQRLQQQISFHANGDSYRIAHFMIVRHGRFAADR